MAAMRCLRKMKLELILDAGLHLAVDTTRLLENSYVVTNTAALQENILPH